MIQTSIASAPLKGHIEEERRGTWRNCWMMSERERRSIVTLLCSIRAKDVVEIGVHEGWTAGCVLQNVQSLKRYRGIDVLPESDYREGLPEQHGQRTKNGVLEAVMCDGRFELLLRPRGSLDVAWEEIGCCDAMLIDGDHSTPVLISDTALARQSVLCGGLIIWHDYANVASVTHFLDAMSAHHPIQHVAGTWLAFERVGEGH